MKMKPLAAQLAEAREILPNGWSLRCHATTLEDGLIVDIYRVVDARHDEWIAQMVYDLAAECFELSSQSVQKDWGEPEDEYMCLLIYGYYKSIRNAVKSVLKLGTYETTKRKPPYMLFHGRVRRLTDVMRFKQKAAEWEKRKAAMPPEVRAEIEAFARECRDGERSAK